MVVAPLNSFSLQQIASLMREGQPWLPESTDYWLWQCCFGTTSFIASSDGAIAGGVLACVNQSKADEVYVDQVAVQKQWRGRGVTGHLLEAVGEAARRHGCRRVWLSTDPANPAAAVWRGPGKHRALFERHLA